jgi:hypothetical protein
MSSKLQLGELKGTTAALKALEEANQKPNVLLSRHASGDWGSVSPEQWQKNNKALETESTVISKYTLDTGTEIVILTEADRSESLVLLSSEMP